MKKTTVERCRSISVSFLRKYDYFCGYNSGGVSWSRDEEIIARIGVIVSVMGNENYVKFSYTMPDQSPEEQASYNYKVSLTTTPCHFGGVRYWFVCPLTTEGVYCGRRVGTLYLPPGGNYFGCRHCYNLSYKSRNKSRCGHFGKLSYLMDIEQRYEDLYYSIKRWAYNGRLTRKARQFYKLEARINRQQACLGF